MSTATKLSASMETALRVTMRESRRRLREGYDDVYLWRVGDWWGPTAKALAARGLVEEVSTKGAPSNGHLLTAEGRRIAESLARDEDRETAQRVAVNRLREYVALGGDIDAVLKEVQR